MKLNVHGKIMSCLAALFFSACSHSAPDCEDEQTVSTVIQIAKQKFVEQSGQDIVEQLSLNLVDILPAILYLYLDFEALQGIVWRNARGGKVCRLACFILFVGGITPAYSH